MIIRSSPLAPAIRGHLLLAGRKDVDGGDEEEEREKPANEKRERAFDLLRVRVLSCSLYAAQLSHRTAPKAIRTALRPICSPSCDTAKRKSTIPSSSSLSVHCRSSARPLAQSVAGCKSTHYFISCEAGDDVPCRSQRCIEAALAVALVHHEAPAHHRRALRLLDIVLDEQPDNVSCLIARGYVLTAGERWSQALAAFDRVLELTDDASTRLEVRGERAWSLVHLGRFDEAQEELHDVIKQLEERGIEAADERAQAWWRLGTCYWQAGGAVSFPVVHWHAFKSYRRDAYRFKARLRRLHQFHQSLSRFRPGLHLARQILPRNRLAARSLSRFEMLSEGVRARSEGRCRGSFARRRICERTAMGFGGAHCETGHRWSGSGERRGSSGSGQRFSEEACLGMAGDRVSRARAFLHLSVTMKL